MKVTVKKNEKSLKFKEIDAREAVVEDMLNAQRASGEVEGVGFNMAVVAEICTFDGKKLTMEDLRKMPATDFLQLQTELMLGGAMGSEELLSSLQEKLGLNTQK